MTRGAPSPDLVRALRRLEQINEELLARTPENMPEPSLQRVQQVMDLLGSPQKSYPVIHVTGTNGKTSTSRIISHILTEYGLSVGRLTSPHLHDFRERISIDESSIDPVRFVDVYDDVLPFVQMVDEQSVAAGGPRLTYFEMIVVLAYAAFADRPVDVAVIEVGLGGSWDATNVADGIVAVVSPIDLDHTALLGRTREAITREKRGIIKPGAIAVSSNQDAEVVDMLAEHSAQVGARLVVADGGESSLGVYERMNAVGGQVISFRGLIGDYREVFFSLFGAHQADNAALAVAACEAFLGGGDSPLDENILREALSTAASPGRAEIVRRSPVVMVDAAHNPHGARALRRTIRDAFNFSPVIGLLGVLADKDIDGLITELEPLFDQVVVTRSTSPRAVEPQALAEVAEDFFGEDRVHVVPSLPEAIDKAAALADEGGVTGAVVATGSVTIAAEVRFLLGENSL